MKAVVLGGTNGQGRAVARLLAERGDAVFVLGRDAEEAEKSAADLAARHPQKKNAVSAKLDLERTDDFIKALDEADAALGGFDTVIVPAAMFATQDQLEPIRSSCVGSRPSTTRTPSSSASTPASACSHAVAAPSRSSPPSRAIVVANPSSSTAPRKRRSRRISKASTTSSQVTCSREAFIYFSPCI